MLIWIKQFVLFTFYNSFVSQIWWEHFGVSGGRFNQKYQESLKSIQYQLGNWNKTINLSIIFIFLFMKNSNRASSGVGPIWIKYHKTNTFKCCVVRTTKLKAASNNRPSNADVISQRAIVTTLACRVTCLLSICFSYPLGFNYSVVALLHSNESMKWKMFTFFKFFLGISGIVFRCLFNLKCLQNSFFLFLFC